MKKTVTITWKIPCYTEVEIEIDDDSKLTADDMVSLAEEKFNVSPREYVICSYEWHRWIWDPKDFEIS